MRHRSGRISCQTDELLNPAKVSQLVVEFHFIDDHQPDFDRIINTCLKRGYAIFGEKNEPILSLAEIQQRRKDEGRNLLKLKFCAKTLLNRA
jgi:hypothetical protein